MRYRLASIGILVAATGVALIQAAPKTDAVSSRWQLDFEFHDPQRIRIRLPGDDQSTTFWYMLYQVTNNTGQDVEFYPSFQIVTDTLRTVEAGADISPWVYDAIASQHKNEYPFFARPTAITGPLLQGPANARTSAAVFRVIDPNADSFTLYVAGLSGEIERVSNPAFDPKQDESDSNPRSFLLRRTLAITYSIPGDPGSRSAATPTRRNRDWVMR